MIQRMAAAGAGYSGMDRPPRQREVADQVQHLMTGGFICESPACPRRDRRARSLGTSDVGVMVRKQTRGPQGLGLGDGAEGSCGRDFAAVRRAVGGREAHGELGALGRQRRARSVIQVCKLR